MGWVLVFVPVCAFENPVLISFLAQLGQEQEFAQAWIRRGRPGFELRHVADRSADSASLRALALDELRTLAQFSAEGIFRPLKSTPNLRTGWRFAAPTDVALEKALNHLYPGALADWFAAHAASPPVTDYRAFTQRQTGMYRIAHLLTDEQAVQVIRDTCRSANCLKRRLWRVAGAAPDAAMEKSMIPCLEPCAVLLEAARRNARAKQEAQRQQSAKLANALESE